MAIRRDNAPPSSVNGDNLLYRLLTDLIRQGGTHSQWLVEHIVADCSVWWDPAMYKRCPVLLPWAVRDPKCRGNKQKGVPDEWGAPNTGGYFRDDNSLIKGLVKALDVVGPKNGYMTGKRLASGWVAAHIWRENKGEELASRDPNLYSFAPNLVWLPRQIAKLSDVEGGPVQVALKSISYSLYRDVAMAGSRKRIAEKSWSYLNTPELVNSINLSKLSYFGGVEQTLKTRHRRTASVISALEAIDNGEQLPSKIVSRRYSEGLPAVGLDARRKLIWQLKSHLED